MSRAAATSGDVLRLIREDGVQTRADLARLTGLSRPVIGQRVAELIDAGLVVELPGVSSGGRPAARLEFNGAGGTVLVASLGHTHGHLAVCDLSGSILRQEPVRIGAGIESAIDLWKRMDPGQVRGVGIALPGPAHEDERVVKAVRDVFPVPVHIDNDVNVMALGEHRVRNDVSDLLFVKASTGIGAGVISGGRLQRGAYGGAGEIGHIPVPDGLLCGCGTVGCVETVAGGAALLAQLGGRAGDLPELAALARAGDLEAVAVLREAGRRIGEVVAAAVNILNPAVVVLGGDLSGKNLIAGVRETVYQRAAAMATRRLRIEPSVLGDDAGLLGCATMILDHVLAPAAVDAAL
ncbi:ROK family transcriptional regulator [Actinocorallia sp. A-T 12471]|uniref:ROK family transcriptional regulator n=1 Tax=Actinocorallia sp. A-T 12471 TaxID=3089813 RepID=UPI0029D3015B|nr:ROK family transcriptional regulator [Actinocorallia sp. A-T 12471]MDX6739723.1 ROK family transcriptional regulator [Actinocorallia sp. A-T 12471]